VELGATARLGWTPAPLVARVRVLLERLGLPTHLSRTELASSLAFVGTDKKRIASRLRLPVVRGPGEATVEPVEIEAFREAVLFGNG
jgi:3-dehydroquinate synthetase